MPHTRLVLLSLVTALIAACSPGTAPATGSSSSPAAPSSAVPLPGASSAPSTDGTNHFLIDGTPAPLSGKASIVEFSRGGLTTSFGIAVATLPQKYLMNVAVKLKDYVGDQPTFDTSSATSATAALGIDRTPAQIGATWTPDKPAGITFTLSVKDRHVTMKWVGAVLGTDGKSHDVDAVMTDVAVPFK